MVERRLGRSGLWLLVSLVVALGVAACADEDAALPDAVPDLPQTDTSAGSPDEEIAQDPAGEDDANSPEPGFAHLWQVTRPDGWIFEVGLTLPPSSPVASMDIATSPPGSAQLRFEAAEGMEVAVEDATPGRTPPDSHREVYVSYTWSQDALAVGDLRNVLTLGRQTDGLECRSKFRDGITCSLTAAARHGRPTSSLTDSLPEWDEREVEELVAAISRTPPEVAVGVVWVDSTEDRFQCGFFVSADGSPTGDTGGGPACNLEELESTGTP